MKVVKTTLKILVSVVILAIIGLYATGNSHMLAGIRSTYLIGKKMPDIDDKDYFHVSTMKADRPEAWPLHPQANKVSLTSEEENLLAEFETTAFLVIKRDTVIFENYWQNTTAQTVSNSFSMAKSMCGTLIGVAIQEGYIASVDQKVSDFIPSFKDGKGAQLTIKNLLQMSSGIPFGESYGNPFGFMAKAYFGNQLEEETLKFKVETDPGTGWVYEGGNTVLLGMILKQATGRTPSEYFHQKIWSCIGSESDAYWNLDKENGMEKTFSGFYATARDFAKFGKLYEHHGILNQDTLLPPWFVAEATTPCMVRDITPEKSTGEDCYWYGYQCWLGTYEGHPYYSFRGLRGQYVVVVPALELIVVRLGHLQSSERIEHMPVDLIQYLDVARRISLGIDQL